MTAFGIFSLFSVFWCLIIMCLGVNFFKFIFEIQSASLLQNLGKFQLFFLRIYFFSSCFLFSFWNSNDPNVSSFVIVLVVVEVLFIFFKKSIFSMFFRLGNFYCSIFKFPDSFFHFLYHGWDRPSIGFLNFSYYIFSVLRFPFGSSFYLLLLCDGFLFSFVSSAFVIACWSICIMTTLKLLLDNSSLCSILVLAFVNCPFQSSWDFPGSWCDEWVFRHCILDILGSMLWDSGSYFKLVF